VPDPLESFRLPHGYASSGDPIEKNPFPSDDSRHRVWRDATRTAEEEEARIDVDFYACLERVKREQNAAEEAGGTIQDSLLLAAGARGKACQVSMVRAKFDAWAKRGTHVIWSDQQVEGNDRWLECYANVWIDQVWNIYARNLPPREASELLLALRNALAARVQFWRAEARQYRTEQETQEPTSGHVSAEATKSSGSVSSGKPAENPNPLDVVTDGAGQTGGLIGEPAEGVPFNFTNQDLETREGRKMAIDAFLEACKPAVIRRSHIWRAFGHTTARTFQNWQAMDDKATAEVDRNIRRVLAMPVPDFLAQLRRQRFLDDE
jgi:hypothetical protein